MTPVHTLALIWSIRPSRNAAKVAGSRSASASASSIRPAADHRVNRNANATSSSANSRSRPGRLAAKAASAASCPA
jgi:hypothetical protein